MLSVGLAGAGMILISYLWILSETGDPLLAFAGIIVEAVRGTLFVTGLMFLLAFAYYITSR